MTRQRTMTHAASFGSELTRRTVLKMTAGAVLTTALATPAISQGRSDKILIGVPSSLSTAYGVADDTDHLNGSTLAVEEINAAGGVLGRELELYTPDVDKLSPRAAVRQLPHASTIRLWLSRIHSFLRQSPRWTNQPSTNAPTCRATPSVMPLQRSKRIRLSIATCYKLILRKRIMVGPTPSGSRRWRKLAFGNQRTARFTSCQSRSPITKPFSRPQKNRLPNMVLSRRNSRIFSIP